MKIELSNGIEKMTVDTSALWFLSSKSFDEHLTDVLMNLKKQGFKVTENLGNFEGWEYVYCNLGMGKEILA